MVKQAVPTSQTPCSAVDVVLACWLVVPLVIAAGLFARVGLLLRPLIMLLVIQSLCAAVAKICLSSQAAGKSASPTRYMVKKHDLEIVLVVHFSLCRVVSHRFDWVHAQNLAVPFVLEQQAQRIISNDLVGRKKGAGQIRWLL